MQRAKLIVKTNLVEPQDARKTVERAGFALSDVNPDITIVIGGDGAFGQAGRVESAPLLFVSIHDPRPDGSKGVMSTITYDKLIPALIAFKEQRYYIEKRSKLAVKINDAALGDVFTDVYLQRGLESGCLRYTVDIENHQFKVKEAAISDGVIIASPSGVTGYYSYPDKISKDGIFIHAPPTVIGSDNLGICHILPTYIEREGWQTTFLRYTVPIESTIRVTLDRPADARLYGFGQREGLPFAFGSVLSVSQSKTKADLVKFKKYTV